MNHLAVVWHNFETVLRFLHEEGGLVSVLCGFFNVNVFKHFAEVLEVLVIIVVVVVSLLKLPLV